MGRESKMPTIELKSDITGTVWKVLKKAGEPVAEDEPIVILESMKMEIPLLAPRDGLVKEVRVQPGSPVRAGQCVVVLEEA